MFSVHTSSSRGVLFSVLCLTLLAAKPAAGQEMEVITPVQHDISGPLSELIKIASPSPAQPREIPIRRVDLPAATRETDTALQRTALALRNIAVGTSFDGLGVGFPGYSVTGAPPDTNAAVGPTHIVQWVNVHFAIFDKTGMVLQGATPGNAVWAGFGGPCQTNNSGDPIIQYDKLADRWIFTQFAINSVPFTQCFAVSTGPNPTGPYNRFSYSYNFNLNDYPKLGVWPDGYYISYNMFLLGAFFRGPRACAIDRATALAGGAPTQVCFQLSRGNGSLLPSDLDGTTPPPSGSPNYFAGMGSNSLNIFKFHADFVNTANSTFTGPANIPVAAFSPACGGGACIPQLGTTQQLDSLADRLMYRFAYRNRSGTQSLLVNHSITATGASGVRWYELRVTAGTPSLFQQGTFSPDSTSRWMGSIAMDKCGDIMVGYSASSSSINPSIRITGRLPSDAAGQLQAETQVTAGTGSQTGSLSRWGDYSSMAVDPADDKTFWYTTEYIKANGSFNWSTRIIKVSFTECP